MARRARRRARQVPQRPQRRRRAAPRRRAARRGNGDAAALRGIKQGVGRSVARAFGGVSLTRYHPCLHDAFHHAHLPLPRAVGPYTIVRTTQVVTSNKPLQLFGPVLDRAGSRWSDICGIAFNTIGNQLGAANNVTLSKFSSIRGNASWSGAQVTPAAFSVQIMNPNALQTTSGIVYIGRIRTALKPSETLTKTAQDLADQLVSYNNPRLCSAAKLAFRGVQVDLVPFNMSELANFTAIDDPTFTQYGAGSPDPYGFAPMFVYNPNTISLQFLVCCEWRVRFDPSNPAQATHEHHPPATESVWAQAQHAAEAVGNGVVDIADRVANVGQAIYRGAAGAYGAMRGVQALRAGAGALALM